MRRARLAGIVVRPSRRTPFRCLLVLQPQLDCSGHQPHWTFERVPLATMGHRPLGSGRQCCCRRSHPSGRGARTAGIPTAHTRAGGGRAAASRICANLHSQDGERAGNIHHSPPSHASSAGCAIPSGLGESQKAYPGPDARWMVGGWLGVVPRHGRENDAEVRGKMVSWFM